MILKSGLIKAVSMNRTTKRCLPGYRGIKAGYVVGFGCDRVHAWCPCSAANEDHQANSSKVPCLVAWVELVAEASSL